MKKSVSTRVCDLKSNSHSHLGQSWLPLDIDEMLPTAPSSLPLQAQRALKCYFPTKHVPLRASEVEAAGGEMEVLKNPISSNQCFNKSILPKIGKQYLSTA